MPPKAKFNKDEIIDIAMKIVREHGIEAVTTRELGLQLGSSARPIFTTFTNMEEVRGDIVMAAKKLYKQYVENGLTQQSAFRGVGKAYIEFAVKEPKLFQLLFMSEQQEINDISHVLATIDENYESILKSVEDSYQLGREDAEKLYRHLWIYSHGIATLCATKVCTFSEEEIARMFTEIFVGLLKEIKKG